METKQVEFIGSQPEYQEYALKDTNLMESRLISTKFTLNSNDYIEYFITDGNLNLLAGNYDAYSYTPVNSSPTTLDTNTLSLNPEADIALYGIDRGSVDITYNFYTKLFSSSFQDRFWISEISDDRTEIRVKRNDLSDTELYSQFLDYQEKANLVAYYPDFLVNLGANKVLLGVNLLFASNLEGQASLLIKLYEPLPTDIEEKDTFWLVQKISEPVSYNIAIEIPPTEPTSSYNLRGPNFNIDIQNRIAQTTNPYNYNTLFGIGSGSFSGSLATTSSLNRIKSLLQEKSIDINVDYSDFSEFVHFSSAVERLNNFVYKLYLIEDFQAKIKSTSTISGGSISNNSKFIYQQSIDNLIEKFDEYEYYLYYSNDTRAWPKYFSIPSSSYYPYSITASLLNSGVTASVEWLGGTGSVSSSGINMLYSASYYDNMNPDNLLYTLPTYIREDVENNPAFLFTNMIGQYFDNLYVYYKDITNRYVADNRIDKGISKELIGDALRNLGINLYTNTNLNEDFYYNLFGAQANSNIFTYPVGSENYQTVITYPSSSINKQTPTQDIQTEVYKRIYHNLPYLLKTKGTERGLRALIACYGIPESILTINQFGGISDKDLIGTYRREDYYPTLVSKVDTASAVLPWGPVGFDYITSGSVKVPDIVQFYFNSYFGKPTASYNGYTTASDPYFHSTAMYYVGTGSHMQFGVQLQYTSSVSRSYSPLASLGITGSAITGSVYENYGYLRLYLSGANGYKSSSQIYLPFYDPKYWWNTYIYRETGSYDITTSSINNRYWLYVESEKYDAEGNPTPGFRGSASIDVNGSTEASYNASWNLNDSSSLFSGSTNLNGLFRAYLGGNQTNNVLGQNGFGYLGLYKEFRYWRGTLNENSKLQQTLAPRSIAGDDALSSKYDCIFRTAFVKDTSPSSSYLIPGYTSASWAQSLPNNSRFELLSTHPALTGSFKLPTGTYNSIPSFFAFSSSILPINGGIYSSSAFITRYTNQRSYELVSTVKSGATQRVTNKVHITPRTTITGSLLSPYTSIQKVDPTRTQNSTDIEVAFSPADQIDDDINYQLGAIKLEDYIGDPLSMYSGSYTALANLRDEYFAKYLGSYNVYDLVRAIKFFDNSLFKMIKDFVPSKANVSTGVVIKSHILERPVYARHEPIISFHQYSGSIDTAFISGGSGLDRNYTTSYTETIVPNLALNISASTLYEATASGITGSTSIFYENNSDNSQMFTGRFGGTTIEATSDFKQLIDNKLSNTVKNQQYWTGSLNYLFNNVTASRLSVDKLNLDYAYRADVPVNLDVIENYYDLKYSASLGLGTASAALANGYWPFAEAQDSDYRLFSHNSSRYLGTKTSSSLYNTYSVLDESISSVDRAYGKTSAINHNVRKIGLFTQISTSSFFVQRNNVSLLYLVDGSGSFTELNRDNFNWEEVQNTFVLGDYSTIKLFDNQKYSNQKTTEGQKSIYSSGYSYYPLVYFSQSFDQKLFFDTTATSVGKTFSARNSLVPNNRIIGNTPTYAVTASASVAAIYNVFDDVTENIGDYYVVGSTVSASHPRYNVPENGAYVFTASLTITASSAIPNASASYTFQIIKSGSASSTVLGSQTLVLANSTNKLTYFPNRAYVESDRTNVAPFDDPATYVYGPITQPIDMVNALGITLGTIPLGSYLYIATGSNFACYDPLGDNNYRIARDQHIIYATSSIPNDVFANPNSFEFIQTNIPNSSIVKQQQAYLCGGPYNQADYYYIQNPLVWEAFANYDGTGIYTPQLQQGAGSSRAQFSVISLNTPLTKGDVIEFQLSQNYTSSNNFTTSFASNGNLGVALGDPITGLYPYATSSLGAYISGTKGLNTFVLGENLSSYYGYQFLPNFETSSLSGSTNVLITSNSLYAKYGDVDYPFFFQTGDVLIAKQGSYYQEYDILNTTLVSGSINVQVYPNITSIFLTGSSIAEALFLTKRRDESNMVLTFPKKPGATSYGLAIPKTLAPDMLKNIDKITEQIQKKLIDTGKIG